MIHAISQLKTIDHSLLASLREEVSNTHINWFESFSNYQSGGWEIASLYNATGEETYDVPKELVAKATPLVERMPRIKAFLDTLKLDYMMARLTKAEPDSYLYEHRDYEGLDKYEKLRLHVPLFTDPDSFMAIDDSNIYLESGYLYKLDPRLAVHGVCNRSDRPRIHLILDCYVDPLLKSLVENEWLDQKLVSQRPPMPVSVRNKIMEQARLLLAKGQARDAEHLLLCTFFDYHHKPDASSYEMIVEIYEQAQHDTARADYWRDRFNEVYGSLPCQ